MAGELAAQAGWSYPDQSLRHWRDTAKKLEVDLVLQLEKDLWAVPLSTLWAGFSA